MIITIEGIDGTGKTTLSTMLFNELYNNDYPVRLVKFPININPNYDLYDLLEKEDVTLSYKMALDRYAYFFVNQIPESTILITDRYAYSNFAYGKEDISFLECFEFDILGNPKPDIIFYLEGSLEFSQKLLTQRENNNNTDMDETKQRRAKDRYNEYFKDKSNVVRFNIEMLSLPQILEQMVETVKYHYNK